MARTFARSAKRSRSKPYGRPSKLGPKRNVHHGSHEKTMLKPEVLDEICRAIKDCEAAGITADVDGLTEWFLRTIPKKIREKQKLSIKIAKKGLRLLIEEAFFEIEMDGV